MTTGEIIKQRRKELGMTQDDLAKKMGYKSREAISSVERNKEDLTTDRIRKYADALECTPAYLMGWEGEHYYIDLEKDIKKYKFGNIDKLLPLYHKYITPINEPIIKEILPGFRYNFDLSPSETNIIDQYRLLSESGQQKLVERLQELLTLECVNDKVHASTKF